jgi:uncharacterized protein YjbI with pentapeptide repeats
MLDRVTRCFETRTVDDVSLSKLLKRGSADWNKQRKAGTVSLDQTGATLSSIFCANADLSGMQLVGSEWDSCELRKIDFRGTDLSNAYFHGGTLHECDFRDANLEGVEFERIKLVRCDFTNARGLDELSATKVILDDVVGLDIDEDDDEDEDD